MKIWIDLANSPHPLLFEPVVDTLRDRGHAVALTARDNAQTIELARERWPEVAVLGGPSPRDRPAKAATLAARVGALASWARRCQPDVALSHNSYAQIVAARLLRVPAVTAMDYEHQPANHLAFRLSRQVLLPEALRGVDLERLGATAARTRFYPGLKEELALGSFEPDPGVVAGLGLGLDPVPETLVVARTPPSRALYHGPENELFVAAVRHLAGQPGAHVVVLARHPEQRAALHGLGLPNLTVPDRAVDSRSLMYAADLVIGAGGTMTREAALMGIPTWSVFAGRPAAVDAWLERHGKLQRLHAAHELRRLTVPASAPMDLDQLRRRRSIVVEHFVAAATLGAAPAEGAAQRPLTVVSPA